MRAVVTVSGTDKKGIIAKVSGFLSEKNINIRDISQTILGDRFAMVMIVDTSDCSEGIAALAEQAEKLGMQIGMDIRLQHADIFDVMHNV